MLFDGFTLEPRHKLKLERDDEAGELEKIGYILGFLAWLSTLLLLNCMVYLCWGLQRTQNFSEYTDFELGCVYT